MASDRRANRTHLEVLETTPKKWSFSKTMRELHDRSQINLVRPVYYHIHCMNMYICTSTHVFFFYRTTPLNIIYGWMGFCLHLEHNYAGHSATQRRSAFLLGIWPLTGGRAISVSKKPRVTTSISNKFYLRGVSIVLESREDCLSMGILFWEKLQVFLPPQ